MMNCVLNSCDFDGFEQLRLRKKMIFCFVFFQEGQLCLVCLVIKVLDWVLILVTLMALSC